MKYFLKIVIYITSLFSIISCQKNKIIQNQFSSLSDTIFIKTNKVKGSSLFDLGYGSIQFKDTADTFSNSIIYPVDIKNLKRFQLKTDFKETKDYNVEILLGHKNGKQIFVVDENNNKDLTDDSIRDCENIIWSTPPEILKTKYLISNGQKIVEDSSWLCIGNSNGRILLGKREHLIGKFSIDDQNFEIGVVEPKNPGSFSYGFFPDIAILSNLGIKKDSISYSDLIQYGEVLNLNNKYYRFDSISNNGDLITLVKDNNFLAKIGTQKGTIAPSFRVITISGDTLKSSDLYNKFTVIANTCGCGGDKKSTQSLYDIEKTFGDSINVLHVDSGMEKSDIGVHIDSEEAFNKDFYNNYRKQYCSRICYVIGKDNRIVEKFDINEWKKLLPKIIKN
ncbi:hypothetical protein ACJOV8_002590 [Formosa sp. 3Alg 14/1]|uniref:hypothetical protein n=1 Tax=Formosa sp. 3Alg 14/1 TaxID=3382190 RepID=UPI0039BE6C71